MPIVRGYGGLEPEIASDAFVADNATVIGDVVIGPQASVWYGAVLRGDVGRIRIGARTNVQDLVCIHMTGGISHTEIGDDVTIGHGVIVHGATVGHGVLLGMGSVILDNVEIGDEALIAAGSVVPPRMVVPPRVLVRGSPAKVVRELRPDEIVLGREGAKTYVELARGHLMGSRRG
jgi:carbonic anhydrase/acetyltransferase-like protein (isoleucine patch superfamily)